MTNRLNRLDRVADPRGEGWRGTLAVRGKQRGDDGLQIALDVMALAHGREYKAAWHDQTSTRAGLR